MKVVLLIISTAYIASVLNMQGIKTLMPFIQDEFVLTRADAGLYSTFFFASATAIALFSGRIVDRIGSKKGLMLGAFTMGGLMLLHTLMPGYIFILGLAFFAGIGFSLVTPSANKGVMDIVPPDKRAVSMGVVHSGGSVGGFFAAIVLPYIGAIYGWRVALSISGGIALLIGLLIYKFYQDKFTGEDGRDSKSEDGKTSSEAQGQGQEVSFKESVISLVKNRYLMAFGAMGLIFGSGISSVGTHFTIFAGRDIGIDPAFVGVPLALFQIAGLLGQPGWGYINDRYFGGDRRRGLFVQGLLVSGVMLVTGILVYNYSLGIIGVSMLAFIMGFLVLGIPGVYFTAIGELVLPDQRGIATSLALIFSRTGVIVVPPIFGYIADIFDSYQYSWLALGGLIFIFSMLFFFASSGAMERINLIEQGKQGVET